jgi:hypothetical protein
MFDNLPNDDSNEGQAPLSGSGAPASDSPQVNPGRGYMRPATFSPEAAPAAPINSGQGMRRSFPGAQTQAVEDMFSETERQEKPTIFQPKSSPAPIDQFGMADMSQYDPYTGESIKAKNRSIVFALMLLSFLLVAVAGWYAYRIFFQTVAPEVLAPTADVNTNTEPSTAIPDNRVVEPEASPSENFLSDEKDVGSGPIQNEDEDGDGLSDTEEFQLGTNPQETDTDGDGLFDREEVKFYKTDPVDTDTDDDGYTDGTEVKGGYNPRGEGKLLDVDSNALAE